MSEPSTKARNNTGDRDPAVAEGESRSLNSPRVDGPHTLGHHPQPDAPPPVIQSPLGALAAAADPIEPAATSDAELVGLQLQARQLTELLRGRYEDLQRRESLLEKQLVGQDRDARALRLALEERQAELAEREGEQHEHQEVLDEQARQLAAAASALQSRERALTEQTGQLAVEAGELNAQASRLALREALLDAERQEVLAAARVEAEAICQTAREERDGILSAAAEVAQREDQALDGKLLAARRALHDERLELRGELQRDRLAAEVALAGEILAARGAFEAEIAAARQVAEQELAIFWQTDLAKQQEKSAQCKAELERLALQRAELDDARRHLDDQRLALADHESAMLADIDRRRDAALAAVRATTDELEEGRTRLAAETAALQRRSEEFDEQARQFFERARSQAAVEAQQQLAAERQRAQREWNLACQAAEAELADRRDALEQELASQQERWQAEADRQAAQREALGQAQRQLDLRRAALEDREAAAWQAIDARREASLAVVRSALARLEERREFVEDQAIAVEARSQELLCRTGQPLADEEIRRAELEQAAAALAQRETRLQQAEALLSHGQNELERLRAELYDQRDRGEAQVRLERRRVADAERRLEAETSEKRQSLERQSEQLDGRRLALEQSQRELLELHRETLELRLSTEELYTQLAGSVPPAALSHAMGQTRARLDDQYRLTLQKMNDGRAELEQLRTELAEAHAQLRDQSRELEQWVEGRNRELDQRAAALAAREDQLDQHERGQTEARESWLWGRLELEQELRCVREELRRATAAGRFGRRGGLVGARATS
ncbi:MAG TPA: hypothetical protein VHY20_07270, partial [Pirellulales bacterium]|nr:hypothetical protein [Pirellulales bacterium]